MMNMKRIGILTSGGDGPGMNAAIRSVTRSAVSNGLSVVGIMRGYEGLIDDDMIELNHRSVSGIINRGGTIIKTARSERFRTLDGMKKAYETISRREIDAIIAVGGDGTYKGAVEFTEKFNIPFMGLPGTIDNDLCGTDQTIGCHTAINTALDSIDKVRDTAHSMERIFVIEVMGNKSGYIALNVAIGAGAETVIIPERPFDYKVLYTAIEEGNRKGKISWMIVTAEGAAKAPDVAKMITMTTGLETRFVVLGHVQRGGTPVAGDRILSTRVGAAAIDLLLKGERNKAVGVLHNEINVIDLKDAKKRDATCTDEYLRLINLLT